MLVLIAGLVLFLSVHSVRIFVESGRNRVIAKLGEQRFKGVYSVISLIGLVLLVYGYGLARESAVAVYDPPAGLRHVALILVPIAFVLVAAAYTPPGHIKAAVRHPMVLGVALWAFAHLLANGTDADLVLFGAFFVWAVLDYLSAIRRGAAAGPASVRGDILAVVAGLLLAAIFLGGLHGWLFGVSPLP
ncbi:NnrU family protein [Aurantimonas sp. VKM B-3413]|uniref:NnrU family protein n=1 Tax=Aurantimonas sp. VKM B-3413 TaxID=2779401 RepID=UPI001E5B9E23|nr:NnrU family protein [Aurantimonas sp. VKM B-3413]MCB8837774.1 NnrU family protein [Aurantimonas sp. VKM B-3413]